MKKRKLFEKIIALVLVVTMTVQPLTVSAADSNVVFNDSVIIEEKEENPVKEELPLESSNSSESTEIEEVIQEDEKAATVRSNVSNFEYEELNGSYIRITGYLGTEANVEVPERIGAYIVQEIGENAFKDNKTIEMIQIPKSVTIIRSSAFKGCTSLKTVGLQNGLTTIYDSVFAGCTGLTNISLPGSLKTIYAYAFSGCTSLTAIHLPDSVEMIGYRVFQNCTSLAEVNYPIGWKESPGGNGANSYEHGEIFYGCTKLTAISIPEGVTEVAQYAFADCVNLKDVKLPSSLKEIGEYAFDGCTGLTSVELPVAVRKIGWCAYRNCTNLKSILLPDGLETIYAYAFEGCTGLESIKLPDSITTMGYRVFKNCTNLASANYPKNWVNTPGGNGANSYEHGGIFYGCSKLTKISIPEGITKVVPCAFQDNVYLKEVELPDSLTAVGEYAFAGCKGLSKVVLPEKVSLINWNAYQNCTGLTELSLPEGVKTIYARAFGGCTGLTSVELPDSIETMGYRVFENCSNLTGINYPKNLINTPGGNGANSYEHGELFYGCLTLRTLTIPEGVTKIPEYVFQNNLGLQKVILADTVTEIGAYVFKDCTNLESIWMGANVTKIGTEALKNCGKLVVHGVAGSYAETYAKENGITFSTEPIEQEKEILSGYVKDSTGKGVAGVSISIYDIERKETKAIVVTDENGHWTFVKAVKGTEYIVSFSHPRYSFAENSLRCVAVEGELKLKEIIGKQLVGICEEEKGSNFTYSQINGSYIAITGYTGTKTAFAVPEKIDGYIVQEIGANAFKDNKTIEMIQIPKSVTTIRSSAFKGCTSLKTVGLQNGLTTIYDSVFAGCTGLTNISLPGSLKTIYAYAFSGCTSLTAIHLPDSVEMIGYRVFQNCTSLAEVNYPIGWKESPGGNGANSYEHGEIFYGCTKLTAISIPEGVTEVAQYAFADCVNLKDVKLPSSLKEIGEYAFDGCTGLTSVELPVAVRKIGWCAYRNCTNLKSILLPDGLETIYAYAFEGCTGLESIKLPDSITTMGYRVFKNCTNLASANYPKNWVNTPGGNGANSYEHGGIFYGCSKLTKISIPEGITKVVPCAFQDNVYLKEVELPDSLTAVGEYAFAGCKGLSKVVLPEKVSLINWNAYQNCTGLTELSLPEGVKTIYARAFGGCTGLTSVELPDSIETMGYRVFENCSNLTGINYPKNLINTPGGNGANSYEHGELFYGCSTLRTLTIPEGITILPESVFAQCTRLRNIYVPKTLQHISNNAFSGCKGLPSITLNNGLLTVGDSAFNGCDGLTSITVPDTVQTLGKNAFANCSNLKSAIITENVSEIGKGAFNSTPISLYVVMNSYAATWAIDNNVDFQFISYRNADYSNYVLDMEVSNYYTNSETALVNNYVPLYFNYKVADDKKADLSDTKIVIRLASNLQLIEDSIKIDGSTLAEYDYLDNVVTIPVKNMEGKIQLSVRPLSAGEITTYARFEYKRNNQICNDVVGVIKLGVPILTLNTPEATSLTKFKVDGITTPNAKVDLYLDENKVLSVNAMKNGVYSAEISLPENPKNGHQYAIKAVLQSDASIHTMKSVLYEKSTPRLVQFDMYYNAHSIQKLNLLEAVGANKRIPFFPGNPFTFHIKFTNSDAVREVYVLSTKNGNVKKIKAEPTANKGEFIATGYFDENNKTSYVPGNISLQYLTNQGLQEFNQEIKNPDSSYFEGAPDSIKGSSVSDISEETTDTGTKKQCTLTLNDEDASEIKVTETTISKTYSDAELSAAGFQKVTDNAGNIRYVKVEIDKYTLEQTIYDKGINKACTTLIEKLDPSGEALTSVFGIVMDGNIGMLNVALTRMEIEASGMSESQKAAAYKQLNVLADYYCAKMVLSYVFMGTSLALGLTFPASIALIVAEKVAMQVLEDYYTKSLAGHNISSIENLIANAIGKQIVVVLKWLIDPSGYVYEGVTTNRVVGAKVTAYHRETMESEPVLWKAEEDGQKNPLYTDEEGCYAWDVPEGFWQVVVEKDGYQKWTSEWLPVPPVQDKVNASLVSNEIPKVEWVNVKEESVQIKFTKYMVPETVDAIVLKDVKGNVIDYTLEYSKEEKNEDGIVYSDKYTLVFTDRVLEKNATCSVTIPKTLKSYAGVAIKPAVLNKTSTSNYSLSVVETAEVDYGAQSVIPVTIAPANEKAVIEAVSAASDIVRIVSVKTSDKAGVWNVTIEGRLPGKADVDISLKDSDLNESVSVIVKMNDSFEGFDDQKPLKFDDVKEFDWYKSAVDYVSGKRIMSGLTTTTFGPDVTLTRSQFATILHRLNGEPEISYSAKFPDVPQGQWYTNGVLWANSIGVVSGYGSGLFGPEDNITREQMALMMYRYAKYKGYDVSEVKDIGSFADASSVSNYAKDAFEWAVGSGIINGKAGNALEPQGKATRAECATIIMKFMKKYEE